MQLLCSRCGRSIPGADIDLGRGVGVCRPCGELVPFPRFEAPSSRLESPTAYRPDGFDFTETQNDSGRHFTYRPSRLTGIGLGLLALLCCLLVGFWSWMAARSGGPIAAIAIMLAMGLGFTYAALVKLLNTQRVSFEEGVMRSANGPIPAAGNFSVPLEEIDGFSVQFEPGSRSRSVSYTVHINRRSGRTQKLALEVATRAEGEFACHVLGEALFEAKRTKESSPYRGAQVRIATTTERADEREALAEEELERDRHDGRRTR